MSDCIIWKGKPNKDGYGTKTINKKQWIASRWIYFQHYGEIPENLYVLHSCDNPLCVNIEHLRLGTPKDNALDKIERNRCLNQNNNKQYCKYGHEFTKENTYINTTSGARQCRECRKIDSKQQYKNGKYISRNKTRES